SARDPLGRRPGASAPTADPTALPGSGARVVARSGSTRMAPGTAPGVNGGTDEAPPGGADRPTAADEGGDGAPRGAEKDGEATRGR
ncbi:hypothetical protein DJ64_00925, partial [Streptomyces griseorubens]